MHESQLREQANTHASELAALQAQFKVEKAELIDQAAADFGSKRDAELRRLQAEATESDRDKATEIGNLQQRLATSEAEIEELAR